jgi:transposase
MKLHANARTCPKSRLLLVKRIEEEGWSLMVAAEAAGISERSARKWLSRWRSEGEAGLLDRSSAPKRVPSRLPADRLAAVEALRRLRMTAAEIAEVLGMALSTVSRWLGRIGLGKRSRLTPPEPPNRYERKRPGELIHVDIKKLGRISSKGAGHRVTGIRGRSLVQRTENGKQRRGTGWEFVHVCVDDATRLAYVEVLPDEKGTTAAEFLRRAVSWFRGMGVTVERVLSDNGACYRSRAHEVACAQLGMRHLFTPSLSASNQRQGRAFHPDAHQPLGLRSDLWLLGRANRGAARLARSLQLQAQTRLSWSQGTRGSTRRAGTTC